MTDPFRDRSVLITGASSGIGAELARQLGGRVGRLWLVARSEDKLARVADGIQCRCECLPCDLADREALDALCRRLERERIDILVNNAGTGLSGRVWEYDEDRALELLALNIRALVLLTRRFLPAMVARGEGVVYNVGSIAGCQPSPYMALYGATKSFVNDFSEALAAELEGTGVRAGVLCPGSTRTGFFAAGEIPADKVMKYFQSAEAVARAGVRALERGQVVRITGWLNGLLVFTERFVPRWGVRRVSKWISRGLAAR